MQGSRPTGAIATLPISSRRVVNGVAPPVDLVTCIEVAEHFVEPALEFETLFAHGRTVLLSTVLVPDPPPPPDAWDYYALGRPEHVALYTLDTLSAIAQHFGVATLE